MQGAHSGARGNRTEHERSGAEDRCTLTLWTRGGSIRQAPNALRDRLAARRVRRDDGWQLVQRRGEARGLARVHEHDQFAEATGDHQYIHVDPERAAQTPFGTTIAHGFLTMSLMVEMGYEGSTKLANAVMGINYGFDKLRFINPVKVNNKVRGRFQLLSAEEKNPNQWLLKHAVTVEIEGEDKPALIAEWLGMTVVQ